MNLRGRPQVTKRRIIVVRPQGSDLKQPTFSSSASYCTCSVIMSRRRLGFASQWREEAGHIGVKGSMCRILDYSEDLSRWSARREHRVRTALSHRGPRSAMVSWPGDSSEADQGRSRRHKNSHGPEEGTHNLLY